MTSQKSTADIIVETKFIVEELNELFLDNFNMLTLDGMSRIEMLQLIANTLNKLEVLEEGITVTNDTIDQVVMDILQALNRIKYAPETAHDPTEFRNGLATANQNITLSLLYWLLKNKTQVKVRAYLSKYVEKIPVPLDIMEDPQVSQLYYSYNKMTQEFWKVFESNKNEKKMAIVTRDLEYDVHNMSADVQNLGHLIAKQKEKVNNIPNKEAFIVAVKTLLSESNKFKKNDKQLKNVQETLNNMEKEIKRSRDSLHKKRARSPTKANIIEQRSEELHINKILAESQLPEEKQILENELHLYETVAFEADPLQFDIDALTLDLETLTTEVQSLVSEKIALTTKETDSLAPFRNQATIIANKKQEISTKVMELKSDLKNLREKTEAKKQTLYSLVGGEVLHGAELKQFIAKLRERSVLYKQYRSRLHSLTEELSLLGRTYDILLLHDPTISNAEELDKANSKTEMILDLQEAKLNLRMLTQTVDLIKAEAAQTREELNNMRTIMQNTSEIYDDVSKKFEESTGFLTTKIDEVTELKQNLKDGIERQEEKWKQLSVDIDKHERILLRLAEDILNSSDDDSETITEQYEKRVEDEKRRGEKLKMDLAAADETKNINELQLEIIRKLKVLLSSIWDKKND